MFIATRQATVLVPSGTADRPDLKHLFILLNDPHGEEQLVLIVSISTLRPGLHHDPTCLLYPDDHPFIRHPSFVRYGMARLEPAEKLQKGVRLGVLIPRTPMERSVFTRICNGVCESAFTPRALKKFFAMIWPSERMT